MGHGASVHNKNLGTRGVQALRAGVRLQQGLGARRVGGTNSENDIPTGASSASPNLSVEGTPVQSNAPIKTTEKKVKIKKDAKPNAKQKAGKKTSAPSSKGPALKPAGNKGTKTTQKKSVGEGVNNVLKVEKEKRRGSSTSSQESFQRTELCKKVDQVLKGEVEMECPLNTRIIRIFLSSTFTDTEHERNALMEQVYPKLKLFCQEKGYEFQVVDMRWGVRDTATDFHETTEQCTREIRACQKLSVGPNFITLLSEKYGYCPLPSSIPEEEMVQFLPHVSDEDQELLNKWYKKDSNSIPASFVLQPVTTWFPDIFTEGNEFLMKKAWEKWNEDFLALKKALIAAVQTAFTDETKWHTYIRSVSEIELEEGILKPSVDSGKCGWFHREFTDLPEDTSKGSKCLHRYVDTYGLSVDGVDKKKLHLNLKESVTRCLKGKNQVSYQVKWTENGMDPNLKEHKEYIERFCQDFQGMMQTRISDSIAEHKNSEISSPLYEEVVQHSTFCQSKMEMFHGRQETLSKIGIYISGEAKKPLVLHGRSGSGKTSIMAMTAKLVREWLTHDPCVVLRFLGTTPKSSTIRRLLRSVAQQIKHVYKLSTKIPRNKKDLAELLPTLFSAATKETPLVVIFDALDQLSPEDGSRRLDWMPRVLPKNVKFVISTLPDAEFRCFPKLQAMFKDPKLYVAVPSLPQEDVSSILTKWLKKENRTLQTEQLQTVKDAFTQCPLPLFLKISFDEACRWRSYMPPDQTRLQETIRDAINSLLERTEQKHGRVLVRHALGYLTAARSGLTASELDDILSCDDEVLDDVFQYWTPPIRRLPPLLWVRIRADLESYLVDRGAEGARVINWYHRQFIEAARDRYLSDETQKTKLHSLTTDYFLGIYSDDAGVTRTKEHHGKFVRMSSIAAQPLMYSPHKYNLRKLHELPHHLIRSKRWFELKARVLCNYEWLETKIRARSLRSVLDDFHRVKHVYTDPDVSAVGEILQLGQDAILADPCQLASQLVSRLYEHKEQEFSLVKSNLSETLTSLLLDAHHSRAPSLLPNRAFLTPPGGQLVETLVGHKKGVYALAINQEGSLVVSGCQDGSVRVWAISDGAVLVSVEDLGEEIGAIQVGDGDNRVVVSSKRGITVLDINTGEIYHSVSVKFFTSSPPLVLMGDNKRKAVFFSEKSLKIMDILTGEIEANFPDIKPVGEAGQNTVFSGLGNMVVCNSAEEENFLKVVNLSSKSITHSFQVFDQEDDENFLHLTEILLKNEKEVFVAKKMRIDIFDLESGTKIKSIRGKLDDWMSHISISSELNVLAFPKREKVVVLNLETDQRQEVLKHPNYISRVLAASGDIIITSGGDSIIRVWDLSREDVHSQTGKPETLLKVYPVPEDPRHVITLGRLGMDNHVITTWDMSTFLPVRRVTNITSSYVKVINTRKAALRVGYRAVVVDMNTWKVLCVLKGKLPEYNYAGTPELCTVNSGTEILTYSEDQKSLVTYSIETGDQTSEMLGPRAKHQIQAFIVNEEGTVLAHNDVPLEMIFIWDVITRELLFKVERPGYVRFVLTLASFTPDGSIFILGIRRNQKNDNIRHPMVWDVSKKKLIHDLRYEDDTDTYSLTPVNNTRTITAHKDIKIVIWDHVNGTSLFVLPTIHYGYRVDVLSAGGQYFISCDDKTVILWNMQEGRQVCSFTADKVTTIQPLYDGDVIALGHDSPLPLVVLRLQGQNRSPSTCPTEGSRALGGLELDIVFEGIEGKFEDDVAKTPHEEP